MNKVKKEKSFENALKWTQVRSLGNRGSKTPFSPEINYIQGWDPVRIGPYVRTLFYVKMNLIRRLPRESRK